MGQMGLLGNGWVGSFFPGEIQPWAYRERVFPGNRRLEKIQGLKRSSLLAPPFRRWCHKRGGPLVGKGSTQSGPQRRNSVAPENMKNNNPADKKRVRTYYWVPKPAHRERTERRTPQRNRAGRKRPAGRTTTTPQTPAIPTRARDRATRATIRTARSSAVVRTGSDITC